ncbi:pyridoxal phosphate-dependent aminotransferase [Streptomyces sp. NPDC058623]|uniref:pyridoxal phosphate-dependent aminotransferase n=1 Tax=Streptomyces sp. NPDC058623 TaxID=3346563 RepID=UPI0036511C24
MSPTAAVHEGSGLVVLSTGDVRVPVHPENVDNRGPLRTDQTYQAPTGTTDLREAIARGRVDPGQVLVAPGARLAIHAVLSTLLDANAEVLLPTPYWASYPELIKRSGGRTVAMPARVGDGRIDVDVLEGHRTPRTRVLVVNSPRNPDGAVTPAEDLAAAAAWADKHGIVMLCDEVYRDVACTAAPAPSILDVFPQLPDHCVVVDGLSKSHALAGLRVGWAITAGSLTSRVAAVASHLLGGTSTAVQSIAAKVLEDGEDLRAGLGKVLADQLALAQPHLDRLPGVSCPAPGGGIFLFPDLNGWLAEHAPEPARRDLAGWLRDGHRVSVVDGAAFGAPGHIRLSFALPAEQLDEGLTRLSAALTATK